MLTLPQIKTELVAAHRAGDWERARVLSQLKQKARKRNKQCEFPGCEARIHATSHHCRQHHSLMRYHSARIGFAAGVGTNP